MNILNMRTTIEQRARQASGRERHCSKCKFRGNVCPYVEICHEAFVRGYIKGYKDKNLNTPIVAKAPYKDGKTLCVQVDKTHCTVSWFLTTTGKSRKREILNSGEMYIELYMDSTWLPYEETHRPCSFIPDNLHDRIYQLFHKIGMRKEESNGNEI